MQSSRLILRVAIMDLNEGAPNQSMRCLRDLLSSFGSSGGFDLEVSEYDVRCRLELPGTDHDIYFSSGGPGNPVDEQGKEWQEKYFRWLDQIMAYNDDPLNKVKKQVFFICYSFELVCMYLQLGAVTKRKSTSFGVFPVHTIGSARKEPVFAGLPDPFYVVDSRDLQVVQPDHKKIAAMGGSILAIEKERPHVPLERCVMAMRFNENMIGTQFHPEADARGMAIHLETPERKEIVVQNHGLEKWQSMIDHLNDPDKIMNTYAHIIPNFLRLSAEKIHRFATPKS